MTLEEQFYELFPWGPTTMSRAFWKALQDHITYREQNAQRDARTTAADRLSEASQIARQHGRWNTYKLVQHLLPIVHNTVPPASILTVYFEESLIDSRVANLSQSVAALRERVDALDARLPAPVVVSDTPGYAVRCVECDNAIVRVLPLETTRFTLAEFVVEGFGVGLVRVPPEVRLGCPHVE